MLRNGLASFPDFLLPENKAMLYALSQDMILGVYVALILIK